MLATYEFGDLDAPVVMVVHGFASSGLTNWHLTDPILIGDLQVVLDTYMLDQVMFAGYSLGARVGWQSAIDLDTRISRAVLGGVPDGQPLTRLNTDQVRRCLGDQTPIDDRITQAYVTMAALSPSNDLASLMCLVEGMRDGKQPDVSDPPRQPVLFATGSDDAIIDRSKRLAAAAPHGEFFEILGRNHFNAPTSRHFRDAAIELLRS
jgi:pimeloyl-ACP methyl ester carboxylesterase